MSSDPRQVEIQQDDIRAGSLSCVYTLDVPEHLLAIFVDCKLRAQSMAVESDTDEPHIGWIVFRQQDVKRNRSLIRSRLLPGQ